MLKRRNKNEQTYYENAALTRTSQMAINSHTVRFFSLNFFAVNRRADGSMKHTYLCSVKHLYVYADRENDFFRLPLLLLLTIQIQHTYTHTYALVLSAYDHESLCIERNANYIVEYRFRRLIHVYDCEGAHTRHWSSLFVLSFTHTCIFTWFKMEFRKAKAYISSSPFDACTKSIFIHVHTFTHTKWRGKKSHWSEPRAAYTWRLCLSCV